MITRENLKDAVLYGDGGDANKTASQAYINAVTKNTTLPKSTATIQKPTSSGGTSSSTQTTTTPQTDWLERYFAALDARTAAQREAKLAALENQLSQQLSAYDQQAADLEPVYQQYRNQSEVERYKAQKALRESLANRGALDSGAGRQETLNLQNNYGNALNNINLQYQSEIDAINRAKQDLQNEADYQKIQVANDIENVGLEAKIAALYEQLSNQSATSRSSAASSASGSSSGTSASSSSSDSSASSNTLSDKGSAFYQSMFQRAKSSGREHTAYEVQEALRQGYEQGVLNESDVKIIKQLYGY